MFWLRIAFACFLWVSLAPALAANSDDSQLNLALQNQLQTLLSDRSLRGARVAVQVVDQASGDEIFAYNANAEMTPASTMKVLTAAAALKRLGPSYRFSTEVLSESTISSAGIHKGNLYIRGGGDPTLVVEKLWKLVYDLKLEGLSEVRGDLVFDEGFFDEKYALPGWNKKEDIERGPSYFPAISGLSLNFNTVAILVRPGDEMGAPAHVQLETPASGYVSIKNEVRTGTRRWLDISRSVENGKVEFTVKGSVPANSSMRRYYRAVPDPTAYTVAAWAEFLKSHGITVTGRLRRGKTPEAAQAIVTLQSPPLAAILMDMNKYSNNFIAESVLKTMGAELVGLPGTTENGLKVLSEYLVDIGISKDEFALVNGSGLTREAHLRPKHVNAVLVDMAKDGQSGGEFMTSLAISGQDGTLAKRLVDSPGRLRGKTGTIDGVHCLAGYVESAEGEWLAFTIMVNGIRGSISPVRRMHDSFARSLLSAQFHEQSVDELGGPEVLPQNP